MSRDHLGLDRLLNAVAELRRACPGPVGTRRCYSPEHLADAIDDVLRAWDDLEPGEDQGVLL